jgi:hypothetical protein
LQESDSGEVVTQDDAMGIAFDGVTFERLWQRNKVGGLLVEAAIGQC